MPKANQEQLENIKAALKIYEKELLNKQILILYSEINNKDLKKLSIENLKEFKKIVGLEIVFKKENFMHLAGIIRESIKIPLITFYDNLKLNKVSLNEFEISEYADKKNLVFPALPKALRTIGTVGNYNYSKPYIKADKIIGNTKKTYGAVLGIREEKFKKNLKLIKSYAPVSLLEEITENLILKNTERKILAIFEKPVNEKYYDILSYKNKDYPIENIYNNKDFYNLLTFDLQEKISIQIKDRQEREIFIKNIDKNEVKLEQNKEKAAMNVKTTENKKVRTRSRSRAVNRGNER